MEQLFQIQELHSMTCCLEDHGDKTYTYIFVIYLIPWLKIFIHACVILSDSLQ